MCQMCVFYLLLLCSFSLISNASKETHMWQHRGSPSFGAHTLKCRAFSSYHTYTHSQTKTQAITSHGIAPRKPNFSIRP